MGYTIKIGNAVPFFTKEDGELYACWRVESTTHDDAPTFICDGMTGNTNSRYPSYTVWGDFCRKTKLYDLFYEQYCGLFYKHPNCVMITEDDYNVIHKALEDYQKISTKPPGFARCWADNVDDMEYDPYLARLIWLDFWMRWALDNCETPAIFNS